jgi:hypothetical protein
MSLSPLLLSHFDKEMMMTKLPVMLLLALSSLLMLSACLPAAQPEPIADPPTLAPLSYQFSYEPTPEQNPLDVAVALINPQFEPVLECEPTNEAFASTVQDYVSSMTRDFEATMVAKQYGVAGPYASIEDMTFGQKENAILGMRPVISVVVRCADDTSQGEVFSRAPRTATGRSEMFQGEPREVYATTTTLKVPGTVTVQARVTIEMYEMLSGEKVFQRNIELPPVQESYVYYPLLIDRELAIVTRRPRSFFSDTNYVDLDQQLGINNATDGRTRAVAKALEAMYGQQLSQFSAYFDPREIEIVVGDAERARERARF